MRKIQIKKWKSKIDEKNEVEEDLLSVFNVLLGNKKPEEIPKGIDKMRLFNRIRKAFDRADETGELVLEEAEYEFLKKSIENDIPSTWGMNDKIFQAVDEFLNLKSE
jgi:hypothetical protein